jgi:hypothetical protein
MNTYNDLDVERKEIHAILSSVESSRILCHHLGIFVSPDGAFCLDRKIFFPIPSGGKIFPRDISGLGLVLFEDGA